MKLKERRIKDICIVEPEGSLNIASAQEFFGRIIGLLQKGEKKILLNMAGLQAVDSIGLGTLVRIQKRAKDSEVRLVLANLPSRVSSLFKMTKMDQVFEIRPTEEQALEVL